MRFGLVAVAGVAWLSCAALLLRSAVPSDLPSVRIDSATVFGRALVRRAEHVERFFLIVWVLSQIALFATLWVYARRGPRFARESAAGPIGTGMLLGMLGLGIVWLVQLPFGLLERLVGSTLRPERGRLPRVGVRRLVRACCSLHVDLRHPAHRHVPRPEARRGLVDPGGCGVRRHRRGLRVRAAVSPRRNVRARRSCATAIGRRVRAEAGCLRHSHLGGRRQWHDESGERLCSRLRPVTEDRPVEHDGRRNVPGRRGARRARARDRASLEQPHPEGTRLVRSLCPSGRMDPDAGYEATRRHGRGCSNPSGASRRRSPATRIRSRAELDQPPHGVRGGLEGTANDA